MTILRLALLGLSALGLATLSAPARAASFDCAKAASAMEKLICADPALSKADEVLAAVYAAVMKPLSENGRKATRDGERQWLHFVALVCRVMPTEGLAQEWDLGPPSACLARQYEARSKQLRQATLVRGGIVVRRNESLAARRQLSQDEGECGGNRAFVTTELAYPLIDAPKNDGERAFNEKMTAWGKRAEKSETAPTENPDTDLFWDYRILALSTRAIAVSSEAWEYPHCAGHGYGNTSAFTWLFNEARTLQTKDLFDSAKPWRQALIKMSIESLAQTDPQTNRSFPGTTPETVGPIATKPDAWTLQKDGLGIQFPLGAVGGYGEGSPKIVIPWTKLQPYLVSEATGLIPKE